MCAPEARVLDFALACGFKTQQHFARMFRRMCGASPTSGRLFAQFDLSYRFVTRANG
ncbi:MAG: helix-turn-helix transcriptional regulator [Acidobacteriaceae bacterium]|nr:helix-turn-helix transcriptional regulator [Acidobacteriaceae bacterium]